MADTLQEKYYGMLSNMPAECGSIGVTVDTTAKTVTTVLLNPNSGYSVSGGGGGLDYVIPEQTVTFEIHGEEATPYAILTGVDFSKLEIDETAPVKIILSPEDPTMYLTGTLNSANSFQLQFGGSVIYEDSIYKWKNPGTEGQTATISAITEF